MFKSQAYTNRSGIIILAIVVWALPATQSQALDLKGANEKPAGEIIAIENGREISLPLLKADYDIEVEGHVATVSLTQTFLNSSKVPLNASYLFPLNQKSAVYAMEMRVGNEIIKAIIKRKAEALKTFKKAKTEGKVATLLTQHRPNMFTQNIANLMPGKAVTITLRYLQLVPKVDDAYELVVPMVVGPRYEGMIEPALAADLEITDYTPNDLEENSSKKTNETINVSGWDIDKLPTYPAIIGHNAPANIDPKRVSFNLTLNAATSISGIFSNTHALKVDGTEQQQNITFKDGLVIDNKDLVVRYELSSKHNIATGVLSHKDERGGFLSLSIEPPKVTQEKSITARELVFVLDTSGSMSGSPMNASKEFMATALKNLRSTDYFRILRFSDNTSHYAAGAVRATPQNIAMAQRFVSSLSASGGTELNSAMKAAFDATQPQDTMRVVVFLTDGYIGGDRQVIRTVAKRIGNARIYAFGVGNSVNRFLLEGIAKEGRGRARYVGVGETYSEAAQAFAADLQAPLLTDISIDWNGLDVSEQIPAKIPDLFAGGNVNVLARYNKAGPHKIFLNGLVNGRKASLPIDIQLADLGKLDTSTKSNPIPLIWARENMFDKNREYTIGGANDSGLKEKITQLGLKYSLQSRFTSFVAVSQKIYNETPGQAKNAQVPLPIASGVSTNAYPSLNLSGSSAPEPEIMISMMAVFMMALLRFWKNFKNQLSRFWIKIATIRRGNLDQSKSRKKLLPVSLRKDSWWIEV